MTQYNTLNVKLSNSQLNNLKSTIKNGTEVTLNLSSPFGKFDDETNFPHKLLSTDTQLSQFCEAFANSSSTNVKFSKTELSKILKLWRFLFSSSGISDLPMASIKGWFSLGNSIAKEWKNIGTEKNNNILQNGGLNLLGENIKKGIASVTDWEITLTNKEIKDIMKLIKSLENRGILLKGTCTKITAQEAGCLSFLTPLTTAGVPLMKSVLTPLAENVLISLGLSGGMSAADAAIQ